MDEMRERMVKDCPRLRSCVDNIYQLETELVEMEWFKDGAWGREADMDDIISVAKQVAAEQWAKWEG